MYVRPSDVPVGQVWRRFVGRERQGQPAKKYQIRDMTEEYQQKCLELMTSAFLRDEPLCQALDFNSDTESIASVLETWKGYLQQKLSLACFTEDENGEPDELVGFNFVLVKCKNDAEDNIDAVRGLPYRKLLKTLIAAENKINVFEYYGVDKYLTSSGLTVLPEHRGQNIGAEIFSAREPLCKALGIKAVCTVFTAPTSQALAAKCGYKVLAELQYSDMLEQAIDLSACSCSCAKVMGIKFDF